MKGIKFMQALACAALISFLAGVTTLAQPSIEQELAKQVRVNQKLRHQNQSLRAKNRALALQLNNMNSRLAALEQRVSNTEAQMQNSNTAITMSLSSHRDQAVTNWLLLLLGVASFSMLLGFIWRLQNETDNLRILILENQSPYSIAEAKQCMEQLLTYFKRLFKKLYIGDGRITPLAGLAPKVFPQKVELRLVTPINGTEPSTEDLVTEAELELPPTFTEAVVAIKRNADSGKLSLSVIKTKAA